MDIKRYRFAKSFSISAFISMLISVLPLVMVIVLFFLSLLPIIIGLLLLLLTFGGAWETFYSIFVTVAILWQVVGIIYTFSILYICPIFGTISVVIGALAIVSSNRYIAYKKEYEKNNNICLPVKLAMSPPIAGVKRRKQKKAYKSLMNIKNRYLQQGCLQRC